MEDISEWPVEKREEHIKKVFKERMGRTLNLENPETFSEMQQWIKLYYRDPKMTCCVDKVTFKDYIAERLGGVYC